MSADKVMPSVQFGPPPKRYIYKVSANVASGTKRGALVDRGANGGILGNDARVILQHMRTVDVTGIDNHELNQLKIVDATAKAISQRGFVIIVMRQYAYHGKGRTIHSAGQLEYYKNKVDDRSMKCGGRQCITTNDGFILPLDIINGLPHLRMCPNTDKEYDELPHVVLTSSAEWDPTVIDHTLSTQDDWYNTIKRLEDGLLKTPFDEFGNYLGREPPTATQVLPPVPEDLEANDEPDPTESDDEPEELSFQEAYQIVLNINLSYSCANTEIIDDGLNDTSTDKPDEDNTKIEVVNPIVKKKPIDYEKFRPYFLDVPIDKIRQTFKVTTQFATNVMSGPNIMQTLKSPYPANNVLRRNEPVASDTIFAEVDAVGTNGQRMAQLFIGRKSLVIDVFGMNTTKEFVNTLEDVIRKRGAMDKLITDSAKAEISERVLDILRALCIDDWQSEPEYQHQNFAERRWQHLKRNVQWWMNKRNVDPSAWLLCLQWVADVMNVTAEKSLGGRPPLQVLTGQTQDISIFLLFLFWDVVYVERYKTHGYPNQVGSTKSSEIRGRFVGFAWNVGHALTFKVLTDDTRKVICRSRVRLAIDGENNLKLDAEAGQIPKRVYIRSKRDDEDPEDPKFRLPTIDMTTNPFTIEESVEQILDSPTSTALDRGEPATLNDLRAKEELPTNYSPMDDPPLQTLPQVTTVAENELDDQDTAHHVREQQPGHSVITETPYDFSAEPLRTEMPTVQNVLPPEEVIERTFLMPPKEDGSRYRAKIIERVDKYKEGLNDDPDLIRFKCRVNNKYEEIVAYNDIINFIEDDETWDGQWKFREILDHKRVYPHQKGEYKGSGYNLLLEWETGERTWEPLYTKDKNGVYQTDPVTVAIYAKKHNLLDTKGWKLPGIKKICKTQERIIRRANQAKLHSFRTKPVYQYGYLVPRNHDQAMEIDKENGNTKWRDAELYEIGCVDEYNVFDDKGKGYQPGPEYKKIRVHMVYAVKHDGKHRARLVAGGHLTDTPIDSVYSSVVSLRGIRMLAFLAELNKLELWATDIGSAYLESYTKEKVYIVAGPEFGERCGHTLIIVRALYGLKSSGLRWHERLSDVLRSMGFFPSKAEQDIWMRRVDDHYEYIAVYLDDLLIASKDPKKIVDILMTAHMFKLKGNGPVSFHLGCDFFRDEEGYLCFAPKKYIIKMIATYERLFGRKPKPASSPLPKGDHPELDDTDLLDTAGVSIYQSLIGSCQWVIQIGRLDITTAVMTMSRFRAAPRIGHLDRVKRIIGYLSKMREGAIRIRTEEPDYSNIPETIYDWEHTVYAGAKEEIPDDAPIPLGKEVVMTSFFDANLYHDLITGKSVTGILHMFNKTPIDWFSKLQSTVESATFGSEYVAAKTCTEQVIALRLTLRYLGVPIKGPTMVFGDNETVINTASTPHARLQKRHNALSYHKARSSHAARILRMHHMPGDRNPADILSKHWDFSTIWKVLQPLMFWRGDTADCPSAKEFFTMDHS